MSVDSLNDQERQDAQGATSPRWIKEILPQAASTELHGPTNHGAHRPGIAEGSVATRVQQQDKE